MDTILASLGMVASTFCQTHGIDLAPISRAIRWGENVIDLHLKLPRFGCVLLREKVFERTNLRM